MDQETKRLREEGCAPKPVDVKLMLPAIGDVRETLADQIVNDMKLPPRLPIYLTKEEVSVNEEEV